MRFVRLQLRNWQQHSGGGKWLHKNGGSRRRPGRGVGAARQLLVHEPRGTSDIRSLHGRRNGLPRHGGSHSDPAAGQRGNPKRSRSYLRGNPSATGKNN